MSRSNIHITIPTPCHESWEKMSGTERGAFCGSCQREIVDFSAMTDREVIAYLQKGQPSCGRFRADQVDRKLVLHTVHKSFFRWKALVLGLLPILVSKAVGATPLSDQAKMETHTPQYLLKSPMLISQHTVDTLSTIAMETDTTIELSEILIIGDKKGQCSMVMGSMVTGLEAIPQVSPTTTARGLVKLKPLPHTCKRERLHAWVRRFLRLD